MTAFFSMFASAAVKSISAMTSSDAGIDVSCPQYGQRSESVPGANSTFAPHCAQGN
ncbi:MAG: hypothetical protein AB7T31_03695 [Gemmatimonadales bacterium]